MDAEYVQKALTLNLVIRGCTVVALLALAACAAVGCASNDDEILDYKLNDDIDASASGNTTNPPSNGATCRVDFCSSNGSGSRCCVTDRGPCGFDNGFGCVAPTDNDF